MSGNFKALVVNQEGENYTRVVKSIDKSFLKHGDVLVKVDYSDLNYKDALILNNGAKLVKEFPHIPGIDFSGTVLESDNSKFVKGDEVILTGWRVGEIYFGGYSQFAKVNGDFLVKKPKDITSKQAMILGTAGLTALLTLHTLTIMSLTLSPNLPPVHHVLPTRLPRAPPIRPLNFPPPYNLTFLSPPSPPSPPLPLQRGHHNRPHFPLPHNDDNRPGKSMQRSHKIQFRFSLHPPNLRPRLRIPSERFQFLGVHRSGFPKRLCSNPRQEG